MRTCCLVAGLTSAFLMQLAGAAAVAAREAPAIRAVVLHPVMRTTFLCAEHAQGELTRLGDAYGKDCLVIRKDKARASGRSIPSLFRNDGLQNADWFGWEVPVLAPCAGTVSSVHINPASNAPGTMPDRAELKGASEIRFACDNGVRVVYAHIRNAKVEDDDRVGAGDVVAQIGNNAVSRAPHIHIGAWKDDVPLQIRFDLRALGKIRKK